MRLNELRDVAGATKKRKRVARGIGSGTGTRGGRGDKGQKSRSGVALKGFEGGQMPIHRRLPKRGFNNIFRKSYVEVGLDRVQAAVDAGRLDATKTIDAEALKAAGLVRRIRDGVRVLGGAVTAKLTLEVAGASKPAIAAVEGAGGTVAVTAARSGTVGAGKADAGEAEAGAGDGAAG